MSLDDQTNEEMDKLQKDAQKVKEFDQRVRELAAMHPAQYDAIRTDEADKLNVRTATLDKAVKRLGGSSNSAGSAMEFEDVEPWGENVDGAELLNELRTALRRYLSLPKGADIVVPVWILHAHAPQAFLHTPRLNAASPQKGCGKTTLLDFIQAVTPKGLRTENVTTPVLFRLIDEHAPTLLVDEYDTFLKDNEELRGALNAGHRKGGMHLRCEGDNNEVRAFKTFAPVALAGIRQLPGTLADRSILIKMQRARPGELPERWTDKVAQSLTPLKRKAARWAQDNFSELKASDPDMGDLGNRVADNWRPLYAITDCIGGGWRALIRAAADVYIKADADEEAGIMLLSDLKDLFERHNGRLLSAVIVESLVKMEERPWPEWTNGKPITARQVARLLKPFDIRPKTLRSDDDRAKGYDVEQFAEAFERYIPVRSVTTVTTLENKANSEDSIRDAKNFVTDEKSQKHRENKACHGVTDENPLNGGDQGTEETSPPWGGLSDAHESNLATSRGSTSRLWRPAGNGQHGGWRTTDLEGTDAEVKAVLEAEIGQPVEVRAV